MAELYTASEIHEALCKADGLDPQEHQPNLTRIRYAAKRDLLRNGIVIDDRGTQAFPELEVYRAAIYTELAGLTMDVRALAVITEAAARRHADGLRIPLSMKRDGGFSSRGGLLDSIKGVGEGETWTLVIEHKRQGLSSDGGLRAEFVCENVAAPQDDSAFVDKVLGRNKVRTRASIDLTALFQPLIKIVGVPDDA